jgi:hypothetical protein
MKIISMFFLLAISAGCVAWPPQLGVANNMGEAITKIVYRYDDSSVPPKYHRSYKIEANDNKIRIVVDSYGQILAQEELPITATQFSELVVYLNEKRIHNTKNTESMGCTGGTGENIGFFAGEKVVFKGSVYHCGGKDYGNMAGDIEGFAKKIKSFIPQLEKLRHAEYVIES